MQHFADGCSAMGTTRYGRNRGSEGRVGSQLRSLLSCDSATLLVLASDSKGIVFLSPISDYQTTAGSVDCTATHLSLLPQ